MPTSKYSIGFSLTAQRALYAASHAIETFALSEPQKLFATLKTASIGADQLAAMR